MTFENITESSTEPPWGISQDKYLDIGGVVVMQKAILGPEARLDTGGGVISRPHLYPDLLCCFCRGFVVLGFLSWAWILVSTDSEDKICFCFLWCLVIT